MISIADLRARLEDDRVVFDKWGQPVDLEVPEEAGPATMLVADVTDALKEVDTTDRVTGSVDRAGIWSVKGMVLERSVLDRLDGEMSAEDLIHAVEGIGVVWTISPTSGL